MPQRWLVVGLGNPGPQYESTRHNVGQMVIDELVARRGERLTMHRAGARVAETWLRPGGDKMVLAELTCYMNVSGGPVANLVKYFGVDGAHVIVVHDDLDIPFETIRLKTGGGHGGHNGVRDIAKALGTGDFARVRVGIGRPPGREDPADWVLSPFSRAERTALPLAVAEAADAVEQLIAEGLTAAQRTHHAPRA